MRETEEPLREDRAEPLQARGKGNKILKFPSLFIITDRQKWFLGVRDKKVRWPFLYTEIPLKDGRRNFVSTGSDFSKEWGRLPRF